MFFLKAVMAQLTRIDSFLQTYFSIFCEKLRIHLENCFVIFFFATAPCMAQAGAAETFNSIFEELIFGIFLNTNVLAEFVFCYIFVEEYCEFFFWGGGEEK